MAAPTPTARVVPPTASSYKMPDGFKSTITFAWKTNIQFWERNLKPPGIDGGQAIETTTMLNTAYRTFAPRKLKTLKPFQVTAAYDPDVIPDILLLVNRQDTCTFTFPENSSWCFFAFLQDLDFQELEEGKFPMANLTIVPTNYDWVNNVEAGPVFTMATGT